jgi:predicted RNA polymerase sigma factor
MAFGPAVGLELVDVLTFEPSLENYHLLPSVRGDLLSKLGRFDEARLEFERAASTHAQRPRARGAARSGRRVRKRLNAARITVTETARLGRFNRSP